MLPINTSYTITKTSTRKKINDIFSSSQIEYKRFFKFQFTIEENGYFVILIFERTIIFYNI